MVKKLQRLVQSFFGFSRTETNAFLVLLPLIALLVFAEPLFRWWWTGSDQKGPRNIPALDSLVAVWQNQRQKNSGNAPLLFKFNPNNTSEDSLNLLGFHQKLAGRIVNYRSKGGVFKVKSDLLRIYGMDTSLYETLLAFIELPEQKPLPKPPPSKRYVAEKKQPVDLNLADSLELIKVRGIGPVLASRIIKYRHALRGFISINQLNEVYGLDTLVASQMKKDYFVHEDFIPRQININTAEEKELSGHPYIKAKIARAMVTYRFQHDRFPSVEELKQIVILDEATFQKIKPYLTID